MVAILNWCCRVTIIQHTYIYISIGIHILFNLLNDAISFSDSLTQRKENNKTVVCLDLEMNKNISERCFMLLICMTEKQSEKYDVYMGLYNRNL